MTFSERPSANALRVAFFFGVAKLFAAATYEGARSVTGPFLATLGAGAFIVGAVAGFGEFLGYTVRFSLIRWVDRRFSRLIVLAGYALEIAAVPALALVGSWPHVAVLMLVERIGWGMRDARCDVVPAEEGKRTRRGRGFRIYDALARSGAFAGPLALALLLAWQRNFSLGFAELGLPGAVALLIFAADLRFPARENAGRPVEPFEIGTRPGAYRYYCLAIGLVGFGFADYPLLAFHFSQAQVAPHPWIAAFYALAMASSGFGALVVGQLLDIVGSIALVPTTILAAAYAPLAFLGGFGTAIIGTLLWGIGLGVQEWIMRAAVSQIEPQKRGAAYGLLGAIFGGAWFAGSATLGALYDSSVLAVVIVAVAAQLLAVIPLSIAARAARSI